MLPMSSLVEVRRFLHCNYNCHDVDALEQFYVDLLGLRVVMRSVSNDSDATPFGIFGNTSSKVAFLYDHRGGRRASAFELVQWVTPATVGSVYSEPWNCGIQSAAYTSADLDATAAAAVALGGTLVRRSPDWLLLRDPEGVAIEVFPADGPSEAKYLRVVCSDLERTAAWWKQLGFTEGDLVLGDGNAIWAGSGDRRVTAESSLVATDDPTFGILLTTWSGPLPIGPTYGLPFHQGLYRMAMAVDDVEAAFTALDGAGVARQSPYTFQLPGTKLTDGLRMMFVHDPDGILIELVDRPRQPAS
jgi:catechol 2,3-dioxygenase-like lactoylglutathione lyase family enzyme